ncbi:MAG: hypothetical protein HYW25_06215 [Candidatus Aenigmarchaeota archaeon]|nr:hypothetical protein [Candidatus Aenigmarchaeota archaeon]
MSEFTKIQNLVRERGIKPRDCEYHTQRSIEGGKGRIRVLALKEDMIARVEYICPHCGKYGYNEEPWKRPFSVDCKNCGKKISVPKMKQQFKREMKKAQGKVVE